jgi:DegV family protein with EDD domain
MHIRYVNGPRLRRALAAGARRLAEQADHLNAINIFPVPDGDTGSNMAATVGTMSRGLGLCASSSLGVSARHAADGALDGARGNSGAIVAQFLHGLAEEIGNEARMGARAFAAASRRAVERTYRAVARPREGTILTVLRAWAEGISRTAEKRDDFLPLLREGLEEARNSLAQTQELLPEAKRAGVVDAGAQGFVNFLEGIMHLVEDGRPGEVLRRARETEAQDAAARALAGGEAPASIKGIEELLALPLTYRYCTEARLEGLGVEPESLRETLEAMGDSLVMAGGKNLLRVHIHSDEPPAVFAFLARQGKLIGAKVDDMLIQREVAAMKPRTVLLLDSTCDLPAAERDSILADRVPARLELGGQVWLDGDGLSSEELHARLLADPLIPAMTSQPNRLDYERKMAFLLGLSEEVVYLGPASVLSGTFDAGRSAAAAIPGGERVTCIDSRAISIASGLMARRVAEAIRGGAGAAEASALATELRTRIGLVVAVPRLERLEKSGRLPRAVIAAITFLGLRPLIGLEESGHLGKAGIFRSGEHPADAVVRAMRASLRKARAPGRIEAMVAHVGAPEEARLLADRIGASFSLTRPVDIVAAGSAISAHLGAGTVGAAWIRE